MRQKKIGLFEVWQEKTDHPGRGLLALGLGGLARQARLDAAGVHRLGGLRRLLQAIAMVRWYEWLE